MPNSPERRLAYFALDVPHKGQASHIHISEIIANLRRLGWQIDLYAPEPAASGKARSIPARALEYARVMARIIPRLRRYDVLYVRAHLLAWPVTFAARLANLVIAQEINGTELDVIVSHPWLAPLRPLVRWLYRSQYRVSDRLFPVTEGQAQWLREGGAPDRITVVANGANVDLFRPIARDVRPVRGVLRRAHRVARRRPHARRRAPSELARRHRARRDRQRRAGAPRAGRGEIRLAGAPARLPPP